MESTNTPMGKYLKQCLLASAITLLFVGCEKFSQDLVSTNDIYFYKSPIGFILEVPKSFTYSDNAPSGKYYYFGYPRGNQLDLSTVEIYPDLYSCTPFALGVSKLQEREVEGTKVWTGRVDVFDYSGYIHNYPHEDDGLLPCRPPIIGYAPLPEGAPEGSMEGGKSSFAYALCSEKDSKRVVVCVQQMTDNPALAEEIFSTFKWTE